MNDTLKRKVEKERQELHATAAKLAEIRRDDEKPADADLPGAAAKEKKELKARRNVREALKKS